MNTGKITTIILFSMLFISNAYQIIFWFLAENEIKAFWYIICLTLYMILFSNLYQGKEWSRITMAILLAFGIIWNFFLLLLFPEPILFANLAYLGAFLYALTAFRPVGKFMLAQQAKRHPIEIARI